jgi:hypothetical protein
MKYRITEIHPKDLDPIHAVGDIVESVRPVSHSYWKETAKGDWYDVQGSDPVASGTICKIEPVEPCRTVIDPQVKVYRRVPYSTAISPLGYDLLHSQQSEIVVHGQGGRPLPSDAAERKRVPLATGLVDYFPDALAEVARVSLVGSEQHHPGQPLHWDRTKSADESDALLRHFWERGARDTDGQRHSAKVAWRALALLQREIEADRERR